MSWHFSLALEAAFSAASSSAGAPSAPWNSAPIAPKSSCSARMTGTCHRSPSGMMFVPSTDVRGAELLTWYLAGFPVQTSAPPAEAPASPESSPAYGWRWPGSSARYDRATRSWRTRQCSLLEGSDVYSETWPRWGSMRDGELCLLKTPVLFTYERGSGLLPTPTANEGGYNQSPSPHAAVRPTLSTMARRNLIRIPTPRANDAEKRGQIDAENPRNGLAGFVRRLPTPRASDGEKCSSLSQKRQMDGRKADSLPEITRRETGSGLLNPTWVEWLMGWPLGWTALEPLEMDRYREWFSWHGRS
jgi:hypothetical protein